MENYIIQNLLSQAAPLPMGVKVVTDKRSSISISQRAKGALDSIKHEGQSYNGLIQELVKFWKEKRKSIGAGEESKGETTHN